MDTWTISSPLQHPPSRLGGSTTTSRHPVSLLCGTRLLGDLIPENLVALDALAIEFTIGYGLPDRAPRLLSVCTVGKTATGGERGNIGEHPVKCRVGLPHPNRSNSWGIDKDTPAIERD